MLLFGLYAVSVFSGAYAHANFVTVDSMNTAAFRAVWNVCIGTVAVAGGVQGSIGAKLATNAYQKTNSWVSSPVPDICWVMWSLSLLAVVCFGGMSVARPAADVFIAGATQAAPSLYLAWGAVVDWHTRMEPKKDRSVFYLLLVSFFFNAPLVVMYPLLVRTGSFSLGSINAFLHSWLTIAWGTQWFCLRSYSTAIADTKMEKSYARAPFITSVVRWSTDVLIVLVILILKEPMKLPYAAGAVGLSGIFMVVVRMTSIKSRPKSD